MGFRGLVVSDYTGDEELIAHGFAKDGRDAARLPPRGRRHVDAERLYLKHLPDLVEKGEVPLARLDQAVRRVLALKVALGLFDDPFRRIDPAREKARLRTPEALSLAREAGRAASSCSATRTTCSPCPARERRSR